MARFQRYAEAADLYSNSGDFWFSSKKSSATFKHSGHTGDVIYSLPTIRALAGTAELYLNTAESSSLPACFDHPYGGQQLPENVVQMLKPLLLMQDYIENVDFFNKNIHVDFDLDAFRRSPQNLLAGSITHWYAPFFGESIDISSPWIVANKSSDYSDYIVVARSSRYNNNSLDYEFLSGFPKVGFVGVDAEYNNIKKFVPKIEYFKISNFLEMATIINSARFFIGNQSFPYSIAEGLKVPRLLEQCLYAPNVVPVGGVFHTIIFQKQFEYIVGKLMKE